MVIVNLYPRYSQSRKIFQQKKKKNHRDSMTYLFLINHSNCSNCVVFTSLMKILYFIVQIRCIRHIREVRPWAVLMFTQATFCQLTSSCNLQNAMDRLSEEDLIHHSSFTCLSLFLLSFYKNVHDVVWSLTFSPPRSTLAGALCPPRSPATAGLSVHHDCPL